MDLGTPLEAPAGKRTEGTTDRLDSWALLPKARRLDKGNTGSGRKMIAPEGLRILLEGMDRSLCCTDLDQKPSYHLGLVALVLQEYLALCLQIHQF